MSVKAIKNAFLIDGTGKNPIENATVVIEGNKIVDVGAGADVNIPSGAKIIDVNGNSTLFGVKFGIGRDRTDNKFDPSKGYRFNIGLEQ